MTFRILRIIIAIAAALSFTSCGTTGNENANTNGNANMAATNANTPAMANTNANANRSAGPTREEYEKDKAKYEREAKSLGRKIGTGLSDGWLWVKARYDLAAASDLQDSTINVDVDNAVITLTGNVPTAAQKAKAEQIVKAVEGVKSVKNELKVVPAPKANTNANANANRPKPK
jgi:hyperosmotically inducible periplasmic protein